LDAGAVIAAVEAVGAQARSEGALELNLTVGCVHDGRFANNAWLLELPHPMTKQCWGNAAVLSPATATQLGVNSGDELAISVHGRKVAVPALILPGHADHVVSLDVGYGSQGEGIGRDVGVNAFVLRSSSAEHFVANAREEPTHHSAELALTQEHFRLHGRDYVRSADLD
jgi:molybdopterin-containing oxidoreductase family iron-sulfur binding subunit